MKKKHRIVSIASVIGGIIIAFILIPLVVQEKSPFPGIWDILRELRTDSEAPDILSAIGGTFIRFAAATVIGCILGIILGVTQNQLKTVKSVISPWLDILRITPALVWISVFYIIFPLSLRSWIPVFIGSLISAFYVSLPVQKAISNISKEETTYMIAQKVQKKWNWKMHYCYVPRILAAASSGIKIGGSIALILVVVAEAFTAQQNSLGRLLFGFQTAMKQELLWAVIFALSTMALVSFTLFGNIEKLVGGDKE